MSARTLGGASLLLLAALGACAPELNEGSDRDSPRAREENPAPAPLEGARALASRDAWLHTALREARPVVRTADGFRSAETRRGDTAVAHFARTSAGPFSLRAGSRNRPLAELRVAGFAAAPLAPAENQLAAEIAPGVFTFFGLAGEALEQLVYTPTGAPLRFEWRLDFPSFVTAARTDRDGNLTFVREDGRALLRLPRPYAVDEAGAKLDVAMDWTSRGDGSRFSANVRFETPDGKGRPLLVDPALEVVFWQQFPGDTPPARHSAAFAYHPGLEATVIHGGSAFDVLSDTWAFDGEWRQLEPKTGGPARAGHAMSYIDGAASLVAFGGRDEDFALSGSTLLWNGSTWTDAAVTGPSARDDHAMTHAPVLGAARNVAFLFGGSPGNVAVDDAWSWNGTRWSANTAPAGPDARYGHVLFYDDARRSAVVFGGARATLLLADIVGYDGAWAPFTPAATPRMDAAMAFDTKRKTGVLFGGFRTLDTYAQGTWEWHSVDGTWAQRTTRVAPVSRGDAAMTYDPKRERAVMFGGGAGSSYLETAETWEYGVLGGSCTSTAECDQYACVDGACCESSSCGPCQRCSVVTGACEAVVNGDDRDSCTGSSTCDANGTCKKKESAACTTAGDCVSGFCSDGVCCNRGCEGTCEACDTAAAPGICTLVRGAPRHGGCEGTAPCGSACTGEDASCVFATAGASCGSSCENARLTARTCDGAGSCEPGAPEACPNDLRCADDGACLTGCEVDADCTSGHACRGGACAVPEDFCEDETTLRRSDGTSASCEPYICRSGACLESCSLAAQCSSGLVCDSKHRCIEPPASRTDSSDSGCGCRVPGKERRSAGGALAALVLMVAGALRRRGNGTARYGRTVRPSLGTNTKKGVPVSSSSFR